MIPSSGKEVPNLLDVLGRSVLVFLFSVCGLVNLSSLLFFYGFNVWSFPGLFF
jgi:hypothetical protein